MLRRAINEFTARMILHSVSPILVKDGRLTDELRKDWVPDKKLRENMPVAIPISRNSLDEIKAAVTDRGDPLGKVSGFEFYLPGTSLRGAWRSHLERVLRGLTPEDDARICDPLDDLFEEQGRPDSQFAGCSTVLEKKKQQFRRRDDFPAYRYSCPVCRMFGNTTQGSRVAISDGVVLNRAELISREHVRVERHSGQVTGGILKFFALSNVQVQVIVTVRNFELWQLLLVEILMSDLIRGVIPVGSGKSKGYGQIRLDKSRLNLRLARFSLDKPGPNLEGVAGPAVTAGEKDRYGWYDGPAALALPAGDWTEQSPWRWTWDLTWEQFEPLCKDAKLNWGVVPRLAQRQQIRENR